MLIREITSKNQFWLDLKSINFESLANEVKFVLELADRILALKHKSKYEDIQNNISEVDQKLYNVLSSNIPDTSDTDLANELEKIKNYRKQLRASYTLLD